MNTGTGGTPWKVSWGLKIDQFLGETLSYEINFISLVWRSSLKVRRSEDSFIFVMITPYSRRFKDSISFKSENLICICGHFVYMLGTLNQWNTWIHYESNQWPILLVMGNSKSCLLFISFLILLILGVGFSFTGNLTLIVQVFPFLTC